MHTDTPDISIIIVNWNTAHLLKSCLHSLYTWIRKYTFEIIVIDNHSSDASIEVVQTSFPDVRLVLNDKNRGFSRAVNQGLSIASGRYMVLFNTDAYLFDDSLDRLIVHMENAPDIAIAGGQLIYPDGRKQHSFDNFPSLLTELTNKSLLKILLPRKYPSKKQEYSRPQEVDSIIGACMVVRKTCIDRIGLLDEDYFFFMEETDWCFRMKKSGFRIVYFPDCRIIHLQGKSAEQIPIRSRLEYFHSRYLFFKKNRGRLAHTILFLALFAKCMIKGIFYTLFVIVTLCAQKKCKQKSVLMMRLIVAHTCLFPPQMRLEGNST